MKINKDFHKLLAEALQQDEELRRREKQAPPFSTSPFEVFAEICDAPCNWSICGNGLDEYMLEHCGEWCNENCGKISTAECWRKYIETRFKEDTK